MANFMFGNTKKKKCPSLQDYCQMSLVNNRHLLGDIGGIPVDAVWPALMHCRPDELAKIEDQTWKHSGVDLSSETWQLWKRIYRNKFGPPKMEEVPPLPGHPDLEDAELPEDAGHYRQCYENKVEELRKRREAVAVRAKQTLERERHEKEKRKTKITNGLSHLRKRSKGGSGWNTSSSVSNRGKLLKNLGLVKKPTTTTVRKLVMPNQQEMNRPRAKMPVGRGLYDSISAGISKTRQPKRRP